MISIKPSSFREVIENIERGRKGLNVGLPMGFSRLAEFIPNIQKKTYYLIGAETGVGKSSFVDHAFMYTPYEYIQSTKDCPFSLKVFYFSMEVDKHSKITKGISRKLFKDYNLRLDVNYILSRGKHRISSEIFEKVVQYADYFEKMEETVETMDGAINPTGILKLVENYFLENGKRITRQITTKSGEILELFERYVPNNPNEYVIIIVDHISLLKKEGNKEYKKDVIDLLSGYLIKLRNEYGAIPVVVQQLNRDTSNIERVKLKRFEPQLNDFKDSGDTQQDANIIVGLLSPMSYKLTNFPVRDDEAVSYDITTLRDRFRWVNILKNRDGGSNVGIGMYFVGEVGYFEELPKADIIQYAKYV